MEKLFNPESIVIFGLSSKSNNIPRLILENLIRWGYKGRILGVNPVLTDIQVNGIRMYKDVSDLPIVPDLAIALIPAKYVPATVEACGEFGIKRMAIPSGGFNELGGEGQRLADQTLNFARKYGIRIVGPNGVTVANTTNGLCVPFVPSYSPPRGGLSVISQSGGVGLILWNLITEENVGMAKFVSIGNKLDLDEVDFLEYFGRDPETRIICLYLESITRGKELIETAAKIDKPVIILKSNKTEAGKKAAMSHTAALHNNDEVLDSAFERAGIIRIDDYNEFITVAKAFEMPPMRGNRMMVMSPAGGFTVMMADLCEELGFCFANPGEDFYRELKKFSNAGIINFSNPLDMGDIYDPAMYAHIFYSVMHNDNIDGAVYVSQWPNMPRGNDVFYKMFHTDLSKETIGTALSSGKPLGVCLFGISETISRIKQNLPYPIFNTPEQMIRALRMQSNYHAKKARGEMEFKLPANCDIAAAGKWLNANKGIHGEESLELLEHCGIQVPETAVAGDENEALEIAKKIGFPVVMKIVSPDAIHKSDAGGVIVGIEDETGVKSAFAEIKQNLFVYKSDARFEGVRVMAMAGEGYDMFIGGSCDESFGPVLFFGYGGIYIEVFNDTKNALCPSNFDEIKEKIKKLKSYKILKGIRGKGAGDIDMYVDIIVRVSYLLAEFPAIKELDLNPVRILEDGSGVVALDARVRVEE
ncbi:MAG: acetate--CoA ligase family protein [bacterium]|nr:acetate--CoA ligase family protein [bacterium]